MSKRILQTVLIVCGCFLSALNLVLANVSAPIDDGLRPAGEGRLTWLGLHVYDATLYVDRQRFNVAALGESRFALALRYARDLSGQKIAERSEQEMARQGMATERERAQWLVQMRALFPDVKAGDRLTGLYAPGEGTRFYWNDKLIGTIDGARFAECFFGIWLAENTAAPRLRTALLKGAEGVSSR